MAGTGNGNNGNRFASVNLNKSYGRVLHHNQSNNGGYGLGRGRGGVGGGGGGMVVLSRPRSAHKAAPKLSVPPPLNLPSLRKEHEKFDTLGTGSGVGGAGGSGARPSSSGIGWSKPSGIVGVEKDEGGGGDGGGTVVSEGVKVNEVVSRGGGSTSVYMPPSARGDATVTPLVEKVSVLKGEDFPSLRATLNAANGQTQTQIQKQKDSGTQKNKHGISEELSGGSRDGLPASSQVSMRPQPQVQSPQYSFDNSQSVDNSRSQDQVRKHDDIFPGPLPLVRLNPRSDWADDERDTSHGLSSSRESRDHGYSRPEAYWDRDFDFPRSSFIPHKPAQFQFDRRGHRDDDVGKGLSNEVSKAEPFVRAPSREGGQGPQWRSSVTQDVVNNRNNLGARPVNVNLEMNKQNKYAPPQFGGTPNIHSGRQPWNNPVEPNIGRGADRNFQQRFVGDSNRYRVDTVQNNMGGRPSFSSSNKGSSSYQSPNFSRDKRLFSKSEKPYVEEPYLSSTNFDGEDPFSGGILGVVKRKKDSNITLDFHDPVRESFEAELERIQQLQEQERLRVVEEQERAIEMARREEEERERVVREQKERQRRLEEEAREAAWRAEQEKVEVIRKAEELKIAKEEEKQRMMMEEERRKQAAKQKLLELEERIARRQADGSSANSGDIAMGTVKERDLSKPDDFASWEDGERMVERITNSASSDSSLSRPFDLRPRAVSDRDGSFAFTDRGKSFNSWRRDMFDSGNSSSFFSVDHENGHLSPRREAAIGGRSFPRKDVYGGQGYMPTGGHYRGGVPEPHMDDFPHARGHRWNISGDGDPYGRNMEFEPDFDVGWGQGHVQGRGRGYSPFPDRLYENADLDEFYSYGRSRYPARQPRVLPPPALSSVHQASFRSESDGLGSSSYEDGNVHFNNALQGDSTSGNYQNIEEENSDIVDVREERDANEEQELNKRNALGCDSQSSLSVSSPPGSPTQLSHDDFDESRDSLAVTGVAEGEDISLSEKEVDHVEEKGNTVTTASSLSGGDDEEWTVENIVISHDQEDCEEDEVYGEEGENSELTHEFEAMHVEEKGSSDMTDNMVLGFDQGVEVGIPNDDNLHLGTAETVSAIDQHESFDSLGDTGSLQVADTLADVTEKALQDHVSESNNSSAHNPRLLSPSTGDSSSSVHAHQSVPSIVKTDSQSSNQAVVSVGGGQGPIELPKLQFGLFSGPSLIPSPVPAIQIGSIQMPLQLHPHIGPPLPHLHSSQPPLFQFGQLRYPPPPMSQGILSLPPQPLSCAQDSPSLYSVKKVGSTLTMGTHPIQLSNQLSVSQEADLKEANLTVPSSAGSNVMSRENQVEASTSSVDTVRPPIGRRNNNFTRNTKPFSNNGVLESRPQARNSSFRPAFNGRNSGGAAGHQFPANKGRKFGTRNPDARLASPSNEVHSDVNGYQRRPRRVTQRFEFRVRQTADDKQSGVEVPSNSDEKDSGAHQRSGPNKEIQSGRPTEASTWSSDKFSTRAAVSVIGEEKPARKHDATNGQGTSLHVESSLKRNISSENDVDAPLQSGVVRVYEQRGIEAPSDEDDFIEVRSKRQMLNDRREQREKENKAKSSNMRKLQHKSRPTPQGPNAARNTNRTSDPSNAQAAKSTRSSGSSNRGLLNNEVSATMNNIVSHPLALVGDASFSVDRSTNAKSVKSAKTVSHTSAERTVSADISNLTSDGPRKVEGVQSTTGSWGGSCTNQSVMSLTQTQLEEAMEPAHFDISIGSIGDQSSSVGATIMASSSVTKATSFPSAASPISSLLAGEKIQFGAVTSPTTSPASAHVVSQGIRRSALSSLDIRTSQSKPTSANNCDNLFEKDKNLNESCRPLEDCEAEAAASAIAVAAIGNDEVVGSRIGTAAIDGMPGGVSGNHRTVGQSKAEDALSVSLPADLSVETPPMSIWPPLPSPHGTSSQMQFPGGPTSHYPYYEMNPMMGAQVFAYGPRDESAGPPSHPQKSAPSSGPLGTWQQCHTGVDSLYGPAGFTAPFINPPPGSIPGVQGPPHMVVYNHFASVGQFGQVGLSYMGTTYVPSGKQPDWKHNPTSTAMGGGEGEISNVNMVPVLRNASNIPGQVPHLPPGSPLLPMPSPLTMYEVSPFQSSPDMSIHPRWSPVPVSSVQTIPQSVPLQQQQADGPLPSQFNQGSSDHPSSTANGFSMGPNVTSTQFSSELESENPVTDSVVGGAVSKRNSQAALNAPQKAQLAPQKNASGQQYYSHSHYQRGAGPRSGSGADWSSRKPGFRGRNYSSGGERTFPPPTKVKQIYVAKQTTSGASSDL